MDVECVLKTVGALNYDERKDIIIKSHWCCSKSVVELVVDDKTYILNANELIKAIENCINY